MNQLAELMPTVATDHEFISAPRQVFLFSGHTIDAADRSPARFPADKEPLAAAAIEKLLDELGAGAADVAISSGACGGDLLFAEACWQRRLRVEIYLPFVEEVFLKESVIFAGEHWREKFFWVKERVQGWHIMPHELGATPTGEDPFSAVNLWMLNQALAYGTSKVSFICLWDRQAGDGPGGTKHLHDAVLQGSGQAYVLDTTKLW
ncbi:MAG: hypothetical protein ACXWX7_01135 [Candidatus Binatia bacterium]